MTVAGLLFFTSAHVKMMEGFFSLHFLLGSQFFRGHVSICMYVPEACWFRRAFRTARRRCGGTLGREAWQLTRDWRSNDWGVAALAANAVARSAIGFTARPPFGIVFFAATAGAMAAGTVVELCVWHVAGFDGSQSGPELGMVSQLDGKVMSVILILLLLSFRQARLVLPAKKDGQQAMNAAAMTSLFRSSVES